MTMERDVIAEIVEMLPRRRRGAVARELRAHLEESRQELVRAGIHPDDAQRESVERLGDPAEIAAQFIQVHRPSRRTRLALAFGLAGSLAVGVYSTGAFASATSAHHAPAPAVKPVHSCHHEK